MAANWQVVIFKVTGPQRTKHFVATFICSASEGHANYLAGVAIDTLADDTGDTFDYSVTAAHDCSTEDAVRSLVRPK